MLLGVAACTDDHFDVKPGVASGANTIWQNIEANSELDSVAMILRRTKVMKSETDRGPKQTFADFLNSPQEMTVWFPVNGSVNAQYYLDQLDEAEALYQDSVSSEASRLQAMKIEYEVGRKFARNHIARFNYGTSNNLQEVRLLNGKNCYYDPIKGTFNDVPLTANSSVVSSNGMLNLLTAPSPFANNIYDYLASEPTTTDLFADIDSFNVYTFSEYSSTVGTMNNNGEMEYVDSVYVRSNELLDNSYVGAYYIENEDSLYITVVPTNAAYQQARESVAKLYNYAPSYNYEWNKTSAGGGVFLNKNDKALKINQDSLQNLNVTRAILGSMFMSASQLSSPLDKNDETIPARAEIADSLRTTNGTVLYNKDKGSKNPIFGGVEPVKASNGYIYPVEDFGYDPAYTFQKRIEIKPESWNLAGVKGSVNINTGELVYLTADILNDSVEGGVENDEYYYFPVDGSQTLEISIMLKGVLSGKYRIYAVMPPNRINKNNIRTEEDKEGNIVEIEEDPQFEVTIRDDNDKQIGSKVTIQKGKVAQDSVSKVLLWDEFEFPYCYAMLPDGYETFPVLRFSMDRRAQNSGKCKALSIACIVLEPIRE